MAASSQEVKQVLVKWGVDVSDWKRALTDITRQIGEVRKSDAAARTDDKKYLDFKMKQIRLSIGDIRSELNERVKATRETLNQVQQQKLLTAQAQATKAQHQAATAALQSQKTQQQQVAAQAAATTAQHRATLAQIQAQTAALRQQALVNKLSNPPGGGGGRGGGGKAAGGGAGGGFLGGLLGGFASRLAGTIGFAVLSAEGLGRIMEQLYEKTKRFIEESGPLEQVRQQFEKLAALKGQDSVKFLEDMQRATHNLVADVELYRTANKFMQSGLKASEEQIVSLTQATVGLARSQGRDATQAVNALNTGLATGRFQMLARITGLTREELAVRGLSATMSAHQRIQAQFDRASEKIIERYKQFGEPALTFTERVKQLDTVIGRTFESLARGVVQSQGMKDAFGWIDTMMEKLSSREGAAAEFGKKIGDGITVAIEWFKLLETVIESSWKVVTALGGALKSIVTDVGHIFSSGAGSEGDKLIATFTTLNGLAKGLAQTLGTVRMMTRSIATVMLRPTLTQADRDETVRQMDQIRDEYIGDMQGLADRFTPSQEVSRGQTSGFQQGDYVAKPVGKPVGGSPGDEENVILARRLAQLRLQIAKDTAKEILDVEKNAIQTLKDANEQAYQEENRSFEDYIAMKKTLREKELINTLREIKAERNAEAANYGERLKSGQIQPSEYKAMMTDLARKTAGKVLTAQTAEDKDQAGLDQKIAKDKRDAASVRAQGELEVQQKTLQESEAILEKQLKDGEITVYTYSQRKKDIWEEELRIFNLIEAEKVKGTAQSEKQRAEMVRKQADEAASTHKKETLLDMSAPDLEITQEDTMFQKRLRLLQAQRTIAQVRGGKNTTGTEGPIKEEIKEYEKYIDAQSVLLQGTAVGSERFLRLADNIAKATAEIVKLKHELEPLSGAIGAGLSGVGGALGAFGAPASVTHYNPLTKMEGRTTVPAVTQIKDALGTVGGYESTQAGYIKYAKDNSINSNPIAALGGTFKSLVTNTKDVGKNFEKFSKALEGSISQIGTFVEALQGKGGPLQAGAAGLASGASLGGTVGGIMKQAGTAMGGAFGSVLSAAGPWGAAAGAAVGMITGIFSGKARKAAEAIAKTITDNINKTLKDYAMQNATMAQTLAALQQERQQAVSQLSGKKGGRDQLDKILPQLDQQITQLQEQQKQIMVQMDQNLQVIGSPEPWQPLLSNIQSVIKQYKDYINAGGDVTKANAFLKDSFANMQVTNVATLNQDMQDAINNALQYNDLLLQRQEYIAQTNQQIQDVIAAGAPTRMRTTAQTKMAQVEQIQIERDKQLAQMNEQITVAGYRLGAEQQIFGLAQTRIGLEAQLASLQMETISHDVARIAALKELVGMMGSGSILSAITGAIGSGTTSGTAGLDAVLQALGLTPAHAAPPAGVAPNPHNDMENVMSKIYGSRGRMGMGGFNGELA